MQPNSDKEVVKLPVILGKILKKLHSFADPILEKYDLSRIHVHYLVALDDCEKSISAKELSEKLSVDKANTSRAINDLLERGFVVKDAEDQKSTPLKLTERGKEVAKNLKAHNAQEMRHMLSVLSMDEKLMLRQILAKISDNL
ncbi:MarR family transcriptional regulator [Acholeplasma vituli]|uniref:MarR family transcriptional regulator n=1 Tax=Paracholeplasma vituli TaxID=69473 RepID=A0ABT2PUB8_9MOLU|nr:MarR family transcriptional regulator [Paracholeplasma vituli]MCU0104544.1 MarR family transcriptional regulator [Paracholeplasma vituli]